MRFIFKLLKKWEVNQNIYRSRLDLEYFKETKGEFLDKEKLADARAAIEKERRKGTSASDKVIYKLSDEIKQYETWQREYERKVFELNEFIEYKKVLKKHG